MWGLTWRRYCEETYSPEKFRELLEKSDEMTRNIIYRIMEVYPIAEDLYYIFTCKRHIDDLLRFVLSIIIREDPDLAYDFLVILEPDRKLINYFLEKLIDQYKLEKADFVRWFVIRYLDFVDIGLLARVGELFSDEEFISLIIHVFCAQNHFRYNIRDFAYALLVAKPHIGIWFIRQVRRKKDYHRFHDPEEYKRFRELIKLPLRIIDKVLSSDDFRAVKQMILYMNETKMFFTLISFLNELYRRNFKLFLRAILTIDLPEEILMRLEPVYKNEFRDAIAREPWLLIDLNPWKILSTLFDAHMVSPDDIMNLEKLDLDIIKRYIPRVRAPKLKQKKKRPRKFKISVPKTAKEILRVLEEIDRQFLSIDDLSKVLNWGKIKVKNYIEVLNNIGLIHYYWRYDEVSKDYLTDIFIKLIKGEYE